MGKTSDNLILSLRELEKEQMKPKVSSKEIIKIKVKINEIETKKAIKMISEAKCSSFIKKSKIDKHLASPIKERTYRAQKARTRWLN